MRLNRLGAYMASSPRPSDRVSRPVSHSRQKIYQTQRAKVNELADFILNIEITILKTGFSWNIISG